MTREDWESLGFFAQLLGPGLFTYHRRFENGSVLCVDGGTVATECKLPEDGSPVRIGMYNSPGDDGNDMTCHLIIGNGNQTHNGGRLDDRYLRAVLATMIAEAENL